MDVKEPAARRGRPPQTPEEAERVRASIVAATADVFADVGSRGLSVALILERAGIARPTFYRYFANAEEPLHMLLSESDEALVRTVGEAIRKTDNDVSMSIGAINAYLDWARERGPVLRPLFSEMYDRSSPVAAHRELALKELHALLNAKICELGRDKPDSLDVDTLLNACEFVGYRLWLADEPDPGLLDRARSTMIRIALATLGNPDDLGRALEIPGVFS